MKRSFFLLLILLSGSEIIQAQRSDTLYLSNGDTIIGSIYTQNKYITKIYVDTAWMFIQNTDIIQDRNIGIGEEERIFATQLPDGPEYFTIPAGEFLVIQTNRTINTRFAKSGEIVECRLAQRITSKDGRVILPENTPIIARIRNSKSGNAFRKAQLQLELLEIHINGEAVPISTNESIRIVENYTAERILGSAASGSVIGGIFYDEWLKGALIGAAVGTLASVIVENNNIIIPENATLEFMLDSRTDIRIR